MKKRGINFTRRKGVVRRQITTLRNYLLPLLLYIFYLCKEHGHMVLFVRLF